MEKLLEMLDALIKKIEWYSPKSESIEWYLLNNLRRLKEIAEKSPSHHELEDGNRILNRFCIDSMDWSYPLFKEVTAVTEQAKRAISG